MDAQPLLQMTGISKAFPGVQALDNIELTIYPGEILALVGENGAGKSTLMKILNGVYAADEGEIHWQGQSVHIHSPHAAQKLGISMIHQELALIPNLDAGKNIFLGREPQGIVPGTINWSRLYQAAEKETRDLGLNINVRTPIRYYSIAQQQMIEVAKALSMDAQLIIMDEPTSSLTDREVDTLFSQMRSLRERGVSIVFISHRLEEVFEISDRVTVLRDGTHVGTKLVSTLTTDDIIRMMVGREVGQIYQRHARARARSSEVVLELKDVCRADIVKDVNFSLHRGEILGIAGLVGAGRTELAETIFGAHPATSGEIYLEGKRVSIKRPSQAIRHGVGLVPEDRKQQGLFLGMTVAANVMMAKLKETTLAIFIRWPRVNAITQEFIQKLDIRTPSTRQRVGNLSGGNQQKVVIAKWLTLDPKVLILDEPTRGIDVGAKSEIYRLINQLAERGVSIIVISSELPEVMGVSDRILVMHEGRVTGEFDAVGVTQDDLMNAATGMALN